jgi:SNF2 family DNA or RNA helicase
VSAVAVTDVAMFHSPMGLFPFQADSIARVYLRTLDGKGNLLCWSTGTGKSVAGVRLATLLEEDALAGRARHDLTVVLAERNKVSEWVADFDRFTTLKARAHHGANRHKVMARDGLPQVLVTTYETAKADLVRNEKVEGRRSTRMVPGALLEALEGKRVLWISDECTKLKGRGSGNHKAIDFTLKHLAKQTGMRRIVGMTATPIERDFEDAFNLGRLIEPTAMPTVAEFDTLYVKSRDPYGRPRYDQDAIGGFTARFAPFLERRRKDDPELIDQFPKRVEEAVHLSMGDAQASLYYEIEALGYGREEEEPLPGLWTVLRQVAGAPGALVRSAQGNRGGLADQIVQALGEKMLLDMPNAKADWLTEYVERLVKGEQTKVVVFTFFGQSVLPILEERLSAKGIPVWVNHGGLSRERSDAAKANFRSSREAGVFLTSDAGARGINLPEATVCIEFESALTFANRTQRLDRIHRIDSKAPSVLCVTCVLDATVEVPILENVMARNEMSDLLMDSDAGEGFQDAAWRRQAMRLGALSRSTGRRN